MRSRRKITCISFISLKCHYFSTNSPCTWMHFFYLGTSLEFRCCRTRAVIFANSPFHFFVVVKSVTAQVLLQGPNQMTCREVWPFSRQFSLYSAHRTRELLISCHLEVVDHPPYCLGRWSKTWWNAHFYNSNWWWSLVNGCEFNSPVSPATEGYKLMLIFKECVSVFEDPLKNMILRWSKLTAYTVLLTCDLNFMN